VFLLVPAYPGSPRPTDVFVCGGGVTTNAGTKYTCVVKIFDFLTDNWRFLERKYEIGT